MNDFPTVPMPPTLSSDDMIAVDRAMVEDYGIGLTQMMENAGRCLALLARTRFLDGDARGRQVTVLAGAGGNGGGALVAARRLAGWGAEVVVRLSVADDRLRPVPSRQLASLRAMSVRTREGLAAADEHADLVVDGLIGYSLAGPPRGGAAELIAWANAAAAPTLALDVPSGVDATDGTVHEPAVLAAATLTLALPKHGLIAERARAHVGELYLADIGVPPALYAGLSLPAPGDPFAQGDVVKLR